MKELDPNRFQAIIRKGEEVIYELPRSERGDPFSLAVADVVRSDRHYHKRTTEVYVVLEGIGEIMIADDPPRAMRPGDATTIAPGTAHHLKSTTSDPVRILAVSIPAYTEADHYSA